MRSGNDNVFYCEGPGLDQTPASPAVRQRNNRFELNREDAMLKELAVVLQSLSARMNVVHYSLFIAHCSLFIALQAVHKLPAPDFYFAEETYQKDQPLPTEF